MTDISTVLSAEDRICQVLNRRPRNLEMYVRLYSYFQNNPDATPTEAIQDLEIGQPVFYRVYRELKQAGLLVRGPKQTRNFALPKSIKIGQLPPVRGNVVHLLAYLSDYKLEDVVIPYYKTKREILDSLRLFMETNPEFMKDVVFGLQERLAWVAVFLSDTSAFINMIGQPYPPDSLQDLIK